MFDVSDTVGKLKNLSRFPFSPIRSIPLVS